MPCVIPISSPVTTSLADILAAFDRRATVLHVAGLLSAPALQANAVRLELLMHLALAACQGEKTPRTEDLEAWLTDYLGHPMIASLEDPPEDVFVGRIATPEGDRKIFLGVWESTDYFLQFMIDTLLSSEVPSRCRKLLDPIFALLRLSDYVADRLRLARWHTEPSTPAQPVRIPPSLNLIDHLRAVTFTNDDLHTLGISREDLAPFLFSWASAGGLLNEALGDSSLERAPLVDFGDLLVLAVPSAVSPACRYLLAATLQQLHLSDSLDLAFAARQAQQLEHQGLRHLRASVESLPPPSLTDPPAFLHAWLLRYDNDKYIHVVLLHDHLSRLAQHGWGTPLTYSPPAAQRLRTYISSSANHLLSTKGCTQAITLIVFGGFGSSFALELPARQDAWTLSVVSLPDLLLLAMDFSIPPDRFLKCLHQKAWAERQGVRFIVPNGDFNLYSYWERTNHQLIPRDIPIAPNAFVSLGPEFVASTRERIRILTDRHLTRADSDSPATVTRFGMDSYFTYQQTRPIYVSLDHLAAGSLAGVAETDRGPTWLFADTPNAGASDRRLAYELWSGLLGLLDTLVSVVEAVVPSAMPGPLSLRLNLTAASLRADDLLTPIDPAPSPLSLEVDLPRRTAVVVCPPDFLQHFRHPDNRGERAVIRTMAEGLLALHAAPAAPPTLTSIEERVLGPRARILHVFGMLDPVEHLLVSTRTPPTFLPHEDFVFAKYQLAKAFAHSQPDTVLRTKADCNAFLKAAVVKAWEDLRTLLRLFDRADVLRRALSVHEAALQDRDHWTRTAEALIALHASSDDIFAIAQRREDDRSHVALSARTILEMAICECPNQGGRILSDWDLDTLLAKTALLIEIATDSDAIHSELLDPFIQLWPNGEYTIDRAFHETVVKPFAAAYFRDTYLQAANDYSRLYKLDPPTRQRQVDEVYSEEFRNAFLVEFQITVADAVNAVAELMELALARNTTIVQTTVADIRYRLRERGLSEEVTSAFFRAFALLHRNSWEDIPDGFQPRDILPWRYSRRLSVSARPLLAFGELDDSIAIFGLGTLRQGFGYLIDRAERGQMPAPFFATDQMKRYIGSTSHKRGHEFAESVANRLRQTGWLARTAVKMSELGAPPGYGDIDILAWNTHGTVQLLECKRLHLARTVAEVAEACRRFQGKAGDLLARHLRRVNWLQEHPARLQHIVGFTPSANHIDHRIITNTRVPFTYLASLPIAAEKIGPDLP